MVTCPAWLRLLNIGSELIHLDLVLAYTVTEHHLCAFLDTLLPSIALQLLATAGSAVLEAIKTPGRPHKPR